MKNIRIIIIAIIVVLVLIVLGAAVGVLVARKPLSLYNIDQIETGLTGGEISELEGYIWDSLQRNHDGLEDDTEIIALVRPSSFRKLEQDNVKSYDFLIDIDELKATYEVSFALLGGKGFYEAPMVDCPVPELMKYAGTKCSSEKTSTMSVTVGRYLPYYFNLDSGELVTVTRNFKESGEEYLNVRVSSCGDVGVMVRAKAGVEEWIDSLGYTPGDYLLEVPEFCDGGGE